MNKFDNFLQHKILINLSKKELLIKLQLEHEEFRSLDSITLNRWIKGSSKTSLHKQLLIAHSCQCLSEYIDAFEETKISAPDERVLSNFLNRLDSPYHQILAYENQEYLFYHQGKNAAVYPYVKRFSDKITALKSIIEQVSDSNDSVNAKLFAIGEKGDVGIESFIWIVHGFNAHLDCIGFAKNGRNYSKNSCIALMLSYFRSSEHFFLLCGFLINLIVEHYPNKKKMIIVSRGREGLMLSETLGGQAIYSLPDAKFGNLYIHEFDFLQLLANPIILNITKRYSHMYRKNFETLMTQPILIGDLYEHILPYQKHS